MEVFYAKDSTKDELLVKVEDGGYDEATVIYRNRYYKFKYNPSYHYLEGTIDGVEGYIV